MEEPGLAGFTYCIWVNAPVILPDAKFTDRAAAPFTAVPTKGVPGVNTVPWTPPEKEALPVEGTDVGDVWYPKTTSVKLDRAPEAPGCCQVPRAT